MPAILFPYCCSSKLPQTQWLVIFHCQRSEAPVGFHWDKIKLKCKTAFSPGGSRGEFILLPLTTSKGHQSSFAVGPLPHLQSQQCCISLCVLSQLSDSCAFLFHCKDPCAYIGPTQINQDNLIFKSADYHPFFPPFMSPNVFIGYGNQMWLYLGPWYIILPTTSVKSIKPIIYLHLSPLQWSMSYQFSELTFWSIIRLQASMQGLSFFQFPLSLFT